jgi:hypothetical protein
MRAEPFDILLTNWRREPLLVSGVDGCGGFGGLARLFALASPLGGAFKTDQGSVPEPHDDGSQTGARHPVIMIDGDLADSSGRRNTIFVG